MKIGYSVKKKKDTSSRIAQFENKNFMHDCTKYPETQKQHVIK